MTHFNIYFKSILKHLVSFVFINPFFILTQLMLYTKFLFLTQDYFMQNFNLTIHVVNLIY